jgi:5'-AMP-activated protein kinase catalytic alpha subunit
VRRRRWYLGIQSKKEPADVMTEIYRVLGVLGFQWKIRTPFGVRCRWGWSGGGVPRDEGDGKRSPSPERPRGTPQLKLALQLYKVQQHIYLLDFQRISGQPFLFMELCSKIITNLQSGLSGQAAGRGEGSPAHPSRSPSGRTRGASVV